MSTPPSVPPLSPSPSVYNSVFSSFYPTSLFPTFLSLHLPAPDLKIVLPIPPPQEGGTVNSLEPEQVSVLSVI